MKGIIPLSFILNGFFLSLSNTQPASLFLLQYPYPMIILFHLHDLHDFWIWHYLYFAQT